MTKFIVIIQKKMEKLVENKVLFLHIIKDCKKNQLMLSIEKYINKNL